jgi:peptidoglycan hydrolase-like protein with peptidoglycan-binding domain
MGGHDVVRLNAQGEHIARLHRRLTQLGYRIDPAELSLRLFGDTTRQRIIDLQTSSGLPPTGIVDQHTSAAIDGEASVRSAPPAEWPRARDPWTPEG